MIGQATNNGVKIKTIKGYRSPAAVLKQLAKTKMELLLQNKPVRFDANDLSLAYAALLKQHYKNSRNKFEQGKTQQLAGILKLNTHTDSMLYFTVQNWSLLLLQHEAVLKKNGKLKQELKKLFLLKASGSEEAYHFLLQKNKVLKDWMKDLVNGNEL
ncbi:hypothetical protein PDL71_04670 [Lacibacter sp. MH-610]|uniref:hypothetical protein n=1 Tax=Lacibacter sp. MH-610 TaxID=3020883 RepID=UPI003892CA45